MRSRPTTGAVYDLLAGIRWSQMRRDEAFLLYRFAACLENMNEGFVRAYLTASRHLKQTDEVLQFMQERLRRYGRQSSFPAQTLCWAYDQLEQSGRAFEVFDQALETRPDDGDLMLSAASFNLRYGRNDRAESLLQLAKDKTSRATWLRTAASLAANRSDLQQSLELWQEVLELEPLATDANQMVPDLLASLQDEQAAIDHVTQMVDRFPHNYSLRSLRIDWASRQQPQIAEGCVRDLLETHPNDGWARRELAIVLLKSARLDDAMAEAELAEQLDPNSPVVHLIKGRIHEARGEVAQAKARFEKSLELSVDYDPAIESLMQLCDTKQQRVDALQFIADQLVRQTVFGDGLFMYRLYGEGTLEPEKLLETLQEANGERPDLWQSWMVLVQQLLSMNQSDEALRVAQEAVERFPLLPRLWLELARVHQERGETEEEITATNEALTISPGWADAERLLAAAHRRAGDLDAAKAVLQRAIHFDPRDCQNHSALAEVLWDKNERDEAIHAIQRSVILEPGHDAAWNLLRQWAAEMDRPTLAIDAAHELTRARPNEARSWLVLADMLESSQEPDQFLAALDQAIRCYPRSADAYSRKALRLAEQGSFQEALDACRPEAFGDQPPVQLRARRAQILAMQGDSQQAIHDMREVVADDPDYSWAWSQLADWYDGLGDSANYLEAADNLVRSAPHLAASHGYRGDALVQADRRDEGIVELQQSIELAPDYFFGARYLLELHLEDANLDDADRVYRQTHESMPPGYAMAYQIRLNLADDRKAEALELLPQLCSSVGDETDPVHTALRNTEQQLDPSEFAAAVQPLVAQDSVHPEISFLWAQMSVRGDEWHKVRDALKTMPEGGPHWVSIAGAYINEMVELGHGKDVLRFIGRHRKVLRQHDLTWRMAGEAFSDLDKRAEAVKWLEDWQQRSDVAVRTLFCLALSLRVLRRHAKAHAVNVQALELPPDHVTAYHQLWLASDAARAGDSAAAASYLDRVDGVPWNDYYQTLYDMTRAVTEGLQEADKPNAYSDAVQALKVAHRSGDRLLDWIYYRSRLALANCYGKKLTAVLYRVRAWTK
jgi:tetratricopeptide (TPR) repeat protein